MKTFISLFQVVLALAGAPLLLGIISRAKAKIGGRRGVPLLQVYYDVWKLLRKGAVYSRTTSWVFRAGPVVGLAAAVTALLLVPMGGSHALLNFPGDFIALAALLGLIRFVTVLAALDTGSSFEGMGASREVQFSAFAEPALMLALAALARYTDTLSLSSIYAGLSTAAWGEIGPALVLAASALLMVLLTENARVPVDDPNTHLELTMIHEVMVLDHGGPDFAFIQIASSLKLWIFSSLLVGILVPIRTEYAWADLVATLSGVALLSIILGIIESIMARFRLLRIPQMLVGATALSILAFLMVKR